jgi:hypothetical protein
MIDEQTTHNRAVELANELKVTRKALRILVSAVGQRGTCRGCGDSIFWVRHQNGKATPYTADGFNHFIDCQAAGRFRK